MTLLIYLFFRRGLSNTSSQTHDATHDATTWSIESSSNQRSQNWSRSVKLSQLWSLASSDLTIREEFCPQDMDSPTYLV